MKNFVNWKIYSVLLALCVVGVACAFPYVLTVQADVFAKINQPVYVIFLAELIQSFILFAIMIALGLWLTKRVGFQTPVLEAMSHKSGVWGQVKKILLSSMFAGAVVAVVIYLLDSVFSYLGVVITTHENYAPVWQKLLAAVYGGSVEEVLMRLFLMTGLVWVSLKIFRQSKPKAVNIWVAIAVAAVIFGLGHLPITASITALTPLVVLRAIVLNGVGGVVFGWLFWKKGLESAMIAHFTADIFLLTALPLLIK